MSHAEKPFCIECGSATVSHFFYKTSSTFDELLAAVTKPFQSLAHALERSFFSNFSSFSYHFLSFLARVRVVTLAETASLEKDTDRTRCMWRSANACGVKIRELWVFGKPTSIFLAELPSKKTMVFEGLPRLDVDSETLSWMDNKSTMKQKFKAEGFPIPSGRACATRKKALETFREIRSAGSFAVVKPTWGSRSRHTRIHLSTEKELIEAFAVAKQLCLNVSVEKELLGTVYRVALVGGKVAGILRRDHPLVVGDGLSAISELIALANKDPRRHTPAFHEIPLGVELDAALLMQGLSRESVPVAGRVVKAGTKIGRSQGGTNVDVTDSVHPENTKLFLDIARYLDDPIVGIDFIIEDMSKPWREQMPCGVIELNSLPFLDLHLYPFEGKPRDLCPLLWDEVLKFSDNMERQ